MLSGQVGMALASGNVPRTFLKFRSGLIGPLNIGGEVGQNGREKSSDAGFGGLAKIVRTGTDLSAGP